MLNPVPLPSQARNPRALITVNDNVLRKIDNIEYVENNYYQPDSFRVEMPLYGVSDVINTEYWLSQEAMLANIYTGFPTNPLVYGTGDLQSLILGGINNINIRVFDNGAGMVQFDGFDLSKKFIDNKIIDKFPNQTSSQIAITLAKKEGLTPIVTPTNTSAGYYYTEDFVQEGTAITEWDLLTYLAQREGFQVFVRGQTLYFQPQPVESKNPYVIQCQTLDNGTVATMNGTRLIVSRNLNYARDVIVTVISWNSSSGRVSVTAKAAKNNKKVVTAAAQTVGQTQNYVYRIAGLSKAQALQRAQQLVESITKHERILEFTIPADNILHKDSVIQLIGVSPSADQNYFPDTITRRLTGGNNGCYVMDVVAKNHSPQSTTIT